MRLQHQAKETEQALISMEEACRCAVKLFDSFVTYAALPLHLARSFRTQLRGRAGEVQQEHMQVYTNIDQELNARSLRSLDAVAKKLQTVYTQVVQPILPAQETAGEYQREVAAYQRDFQSFLNANEVDLRAFLCHPSFERQFLFVVGDSDGQDRIQQLRQALGQSNADNDNSTRGTSNNIQQSSNASNLARDLLASCSILSANERVQYAIALEQAVTEHDSHIASLRAEQTASSTLVGASHESTQHDMAQTPVKTSSLNRVQLLALQAYAKEAMLDSNLANVETNLHVSEDDRICATHDDDEWRDPSEEWLLSPQPVGSNPFAHMKRTTPANAAKITEALARGEISRHCLLSAATWHRQQAQWTRRLEQAIDTMSLPSGTSPGPGAAAMQNSGAECVSQLILTTPLIISELTRLSLLIRRASLVHDSSESNDMTGFRPERISPSEPTQTPLVEALSCLQNAYEELLTDMLLSLMIRLCRFVGASSSSTESTTSYFTLGTSLLEALHALDKMPLLIHSIREMLVRPSIKSCLTKHLMSATVMPQQLSVSGPSALPPLYATLYSNFRTLWAFVSKVCSYSGASTSPYMIDFVTHCFWPELVDLFLSESLGPLFAAVLDTFAPSLTNFLLFYNAICDHVSFLNPHQSSNLLATLDNTVKPLLAKWSITTYTRLLQRHLQTSLPARSDVSPIPQDRPQALERNQVLSSGSLVSDISSNETPHFWLPTSHHIMNSLLYVWKNNVILPQTLAFTLERTAELGNTLVEEFDMMLRGLTALPIGADRALTSIQTLPSTLAEVVPPKPLHFTEVLRRASLFTSRMQDGLITTSFSPDQDCPDADPSGLFPLPKEAFVALATEKIQPVLALLADASAFYTVFGSTGDHMNPLVDYVRRQLDTPRFVKAFVALTHNTTMVQEATKRTLRTYEELLEGLAKTKLRPLQLALINVLSCFVSMEALAAVEPGIKAIKSEFLAGDRSPQGASNYVACIVAPFCDLLALMQRVRAHSSARSVIPRILESTALAFSRYVVPEVTKTMSTVLATTSAAQASLQRIKAASGITVTVGMTTEDKVQQQVWIDANQLARSIDNIITKSLLSFQDVYDVTAAVSAVRAEITNLLKLVGDSVREELKDDSL